MAPQEGVWQSQQPKDVPLVLCGMSTADRTECSRRDSKSTANIARKDLAACPPETAQDTSRFEQGSRPPLSARGKNRQRHVLASQHLPNLPRPRIPIWAHPFPRVSRPPKVRPHACFLALDRLSKVNPTCTHIAQGNTCLVDSTRQQFETCRCCSSRYSTDSMRNLLVFL